jgi:hypothetical protein
MTKSIRKALTLVVRHCLDALTEKEVVSFVTFLAADVSHETISKQTWFEKIRPLYVPGGTILSKVVVSEIAKYAEEKFN